MRSNLLAMVRSTSRSYSWSIARLPGELSDQMAVAYLLLRAADCLEDNPALRECDRTALLHLWAEILGGTAPVSSLIGEVAGLGAGDPEVHLVRSIGVVLAELAAFPRAPQEAIRSHVARTSLGMAHWQARGVQVADEADMDDYMYHVAGLVGYLVTDLITLYSPSAREHRSGLVSLARDFGLGFQSVNILAGLRPDFEHGRVYIPTTMYRGAGLMTPAGLFKRAHVEQAMKVVRALARKAEGHLHYGLRYVLTLPRDEYGIRLAMALPLLTSAALLGKSRTDSRVLVAEPVLTEAEKRRMMVLASSLCWSDGWITHYYRALIRDHSSDDRSDPVLRCTGPGL